MPDINSLPPSQQTDGLTPPTSSPLSTDLSQDTSLIVKGGSSDMTTVPVSPPLVSDPVPSPFDEKSLDASLSALKDIQTTLTTPASASVVQQPETITEQAIPTEISTPVISEEKVEVRVPPPTTDAVSSGTGDAKTVLDVIFAENKITKEQYDDVKVKSALGNQNPDEILKSLGIVSEDVFVEAKAKLLNVPYVSLSSMSFSPEALSLLPRAVVDRFQLIPVHFDEKSKTLSIAMSNPVDLDAINFVQQKTGMTIKSLAASPTDVKNAIDQQYRQELVGEVGAAVKETEQFARRTVDSAQIGQIIKEAPIAKIVSTILEYAVTSRSSDVHIEPQEDRLRVRYRIDGILYDKLSLPKNVQEALISRIKILSEMKIDEHRTPQDGRFNFKIGENEVDLRISVVPTVDGEKIVMRLLRKSGGIPSFQELGLGGPSLKSLETAISRPHGIILVCGPTGSGKTTTLYSVLSKLNTPKVNIMSLEDPVEYQMPGINQVQINPGVGLTFASGLRSFLRQDPNIVLVGEIRDKETTDLAMQAALTGHLVFSTLHTSDAAGALPRLLDLGAETFLLVSTINAIVGQRIVRKICEYCKVTVPPLPQELNEMKTTLGSLYTLQDAEVKVTKGKGCNECANSGYNGRVGIYEVLSATEKLGKLVLEHAASEAIQKQAIADGMITMMQDGYLKVLAGVTTIEEVLRVAQE
jgi:type IV pilus assembly protein PilB